MRKFAIHGLALLIALTIAAPASAQFGGLGKKLKKKAKKETIGRVTDRHDDENKKLHPLLDPKVKRGDRYANAEAALKEIDALIAKKKTTPETWFYLAQATLWYLEGGRFDEITAPKQLEMAQRGVEAVDKATKKFKFPPYAEERVNLLKGDILSGLNKQVTYWKAEAAKVDRMAAIVEQLKAEFKASWDKREERDAKALAALKSGQEAFKAGDVKKAGDMYVAARAAYIEGVRPLCESQDDLLEKLTEGTGLAIANAFVELFQKEGDGAGILREAELLEHSRDLLSFEEEQKIYLYNKLVRSRYEGFDKRYYTIDPSWEATAEKTKESKGKLAKQLLANLRDYNPESRDRMKVIEGFAGYKGKLVWWTAELTKATKKMLTFDTSYKDVEYYDCRETKKIKQITDDGRFIYEQKCKERKVTRHRGNFKVEVGDPDLPSLAKGFKVSVAGTISKLAGKWLTLTGGHIIWIKNPDGKLIWAYGVSLE